MVSFVKLVPSEFPRYDHSFISLVPVSFVDENKRVSNFDSNIMLDPLLLNCHFVQIGRASCRERVLRLV